MYPFVYMKNDIVLNKKKKCFYSLGILNNSIINKISFVLNFMYMYSWIYSRILTEIIIYTIWKNLICANYTCICACNLEFEK